MPAQTFDWRDDPSGTIIAVPEVRARFLRREPGDPPGSFHSHEESDGIETWVVLEGAVRFEFDDRAVVATPGQAVVAYPHERHRISCAGDEPCVISLPSRPTASRPTPSTTPSATACRPGAAPSIPPGRAGRPSARVRPERSAAPYGILAESGST